MYIGLHVKYPLFLTDFIKLEFSLHIFEKPSNTKFIKIRPVGAELFHADGHDEAKSSIWLFFERAYSKNIWSGTFGGRPQNLF